MGHVLAGLTNPKHSRTQVILTNYLEVPLDGCALIGNTRKLICIIVKEKKKVAHCSDKAPFTSITKKSTCLKNALHL